MDTSNNQGGGGGGGGAPSPAAAAPKKEAGAGAIIGVIIIVIVLILGGLYFWGAQLYKGSLAPENEPAVPSSDSATALEAELNALATEDSSNDLNAAERELQ